MRIKPVENMRKPEYPLKDQIGAEELKSLLPKRWAGSSAAKAALGALAAMTLAGCVPDIPLAGVPVPPSTMTEGTVVTPAITEYMPEGTAEPAMLRVAPMFLHGEGRGAFGCVMIAPPVFLSESDALTVINEAAKEFGLKFTPGGGPKFTEVLQPVTNIYGEEPKPSTKAMTLKPDFTDKEHGVVIEYISVDDVKKWHKETGYEMSVEAYETQDAADQLSDSLERAVPEDNGFYTVGVLYDPCETDRPEEPWDQEERNEAEAKARKMSQQQLKAQAVDFFEWLKAQGVI